MTIDLFNGHPKQCQHCGAQHQRVTFTPERAHLFSGEPHVKYLCQNCTFETHAALERCEEMVIERWNHGTPSIVVHGMLSPKSGQPLDIDEFYEYFSHCHQRPETRGAAA